MKPSPQHTSGLTDFLAALAVFAQHYPTGRINKRFGAYRHDYFTRVSVWFPATRAAWDAEVQRLGNRLATAWYLDYTRRDIYGREIDWADDIDILDTFQFPSPAVVNADPVLGAALVKRAIGFMKG